MRILCGTDFSQHAVEAGRVAAVLAMRTRGKVVLAHAMDVSRYELPSKELLDYLRSSRKKKLKLEADRLRHQGAEIEESFVEGSPAASLVSEGSKSSADLIVVGSLGQGAVIAEDNVLGVTLIIVKTDPLRIDPLQLNASNPLRRGGATCPTIETAVGFAVCWAGNQIVALIGRPHATQAQTAEIKLHRRGQPRVLTGHDFGRVQERHAQRPPLAYRIAEANEQSAIGRVCERFDVQTARRFGGTSRCCGEIVRSQSRFLEQVRQQVCVSTSHGFEIHVRSVALQFKREKPMPPGSRIACRVPAMRGDPINAVANAGGCFEIALRRFLRSEQKRSQVKRSYWLAGLVEPVEPQDIVLVAGGSEQVPLQLHRRRGVAHAAKDDRGRR